MGVRVRVRLLFVLLVLSLTLPLAARTKIQGYAEQGGQRHLNSGIFGITRGGATQTNPYSQQSYPNATVTVYLTGTLTTATLYSDPSGTAKSNPFTASSNAYWSFYIDSGTYDIRFSGGGITTPFTWSGVTTEVDSLSVSITGFGARCDGSTDDTVAIQAAYDLVSAVSGIRKTVLWPAGTCITTDEIRITGDSVYTIGQGHWATIIDFQPTVDDKASLRIGTLDGSPSYRHGISDIGILSSNITLRKFGIRIDRASQTSVRNVTIGAGGTFTGGSAISPFTGNSSSGLYLRGWEIQEFNNLAIKSDIPVRVGPNAGDPNLSLDLSHFEDMYLLPSGTNPSYYIEPGVVVTSVTLDGIQSWVGGGYGLYWKDMTAAASSFNLSIYNARTEQFSSPGHQIYIERNLALQGLRVQDSYGGSTNKGIFLRGVSEVTLDHFAYYGTLEGLNADSTVNRIRCSNCLFESNSTVSMGTLKEIWSSGFVNALAPLPKDFLYETPGASLNSGSAYRFMGVYQYCRAPFTMADAATEPIVIFSGAIRQGIITWTAKGATQHIGGMTMMDSTGVFKLAGNGALGVGGVPGEITVQYSSAASIFFNNRLGESVDVQYCWTLTKN